jgi:hypothetical protein
MCDCERQSYKWDNKEIKAVSIDFDGVIHKYSEGWKDGSIYDELSWDWECFIRDNIGNFPIFIMSTRSPEQIKEWIEKKIGVNFEIITGDDTFWSKLDCIGITNKKLPATIYFDDRAFNTNWSFSIEKLRELDIQ